MRHLQAYSSKGTKIQVQVYMEFKAFWMLACVFAGIAQARSVGIVLQRPSSEYRDQSLQAAIRSGVDLEGCFLCNLLRPLIKISFLLVPFGYIIFKIRKDS